MNMRYLILTTGVLLLTSACDAQYNREDYLSTVHELYPKAEAIDIEFKEDYAEIEFRCDGTNFELAVDHNQQIIYTETEARIPKSVMGKIDKKLAKKYDGWSRDEHSLIEMGDTSFYKFELIKGGVEQNAYFTTDGKYFRYTGISAIKNSVFREIARSEVYARSRYAYYNPAEIYELPDVLVEVSGIALDENGHIYCVQDEVGAVFKFNSQTETVEDIYRFTDTGDFEDLAIYGDKISVLRSDGNLFQIDRQRGGGQVESQMLSIGCLNAEGLFFSSIQNELFVACKEAGSDDGKDQRTIYRFDSNDHSASIGTFTIDVAEINKFLKKEYRDIDIGTLSFNPSAFAIHPKTGEYFILSASDRLMVVYDKGSLKEAYPLPEERYYKPEGMAFVANGDLFLSSEGVKKGPIPGQVYFLPMAK